MRLSTCDMAKSFESHASQRDASQRVQVKSTQRIIQYLRRTSGSYSNLLRLLNWRRMLFVTGTPIAGCLRDLLSPLTLIAHTNSSIGGLSTLPSVAGYNPGLYLEDYNPFDDSFELSKGKGYLV
jgi:hypothetical protein